MNVASDVDPGAILRIGEVASRAGVSPRTLRYHEELGLLTPAATARVAHADTPRPMSPGWCGSESSKT